MQDSKLNRFLKFAPIALITLLFFSIQTASAQSKSFYWERFDANMTLLVNGDIQVSERQTLVFSGGSFTFGFRTIPTGSEGQNDGIEIQAVREGDHVFQNDNSSNAGTYRLSHSSDEVRVDWYFSPTNGRHTYTIDYLIKNPILVGTFEEGDGDQIFWKPLPSDLLSSRVENSQITLNLPQGVQPQQYLSGEGYLVEGTINGASDGVTSSVSENGRTLTYETNLFIYSGDTFEIRTQFPHGVLDVPVPDWQQQQLQNDTTQLSIFIMAILLVCGGPLGVLALWYLYGRDPQLAVTPPEYITEPPSDLPPAVVGTLVDERADMHDIISTLVDLARRGFLTIQEVGKNDHLFLKVAAAPVADLRPYERKFYDAIFKNREQTELSDLKHKFYATIPKLKNLLYDELVDLNYAPASPQNVRNRFAVFGWAVLAMGFASMFIIGAMLPSAIAGAGFCPAAAIGLTGAILIYVSRHMPRKTVKGTEEAAKWLAFKTYLERIEKYEEVEAATDLFDKYLAYATAFGIERSWIRKFSKTTRTRTPTWYHPVPTYGGSRGYGRQTKIPTVQKGGEGGGPSLEGLSGGLSGGLSSMSGGLTRMLNASSRTMRSTPPSTSSSSGGFSGGFSGGGSFSSGGGGSGGFG